ncbi:hypothetical protein A9W99_18580 [Mycobacterium sp. 1164966.3]|uniref:antitoxin Xre/MbcA/ParS toxin-binding domain-containing protein n=1 Tax=Mycobacterium sp. 1164966.3 TaxID=1856861 RepID=UPI0007FD06D3|nr:antitoxin Xre/MbcA/ParS toxin-binding domain-containing protein [Mycobacterium sp. 1164966.3]OBA80105.1 hypothetical protein A9W99_18580 [Mycobacterium sp. 1164966.3]
MKTSIGIMAVAFLRLTETVGESGPETAVSDALKRSAPLLLVTDDLDARYPIQTAILIIRPPSDEPQLPVWHRDDWDDATHFSVAAIVVAGRRDTFSTQFLLDKYIAELRGQMASSSTPLFFYDPSLDPVPVDLREILIGLTHDMSPLETLSLPLFIQAAGGEHRAQVVIDSAIKQRGGDEQSALETFAMETRGVLEGATENWSFDSAVDWLRSPNAFLNGARPIDVLVMEGSRTVVDAAYATTWSLFG